MAFYLFFYKIYIDICISFYLQADRSIVLMPTGLSVCQRFGEDRATHFHGPDIKLFVSISRDPGMCISQLTCKVIQPQCLTLLKVA